MQLWGFARRGRGSSKSTVAAMTGRGTVASTGSRQPQTAVTRTYESSHELHEARQEMRRQGWYLISAWGEADGRVVALWAAGNKRVAA